MISGYNHHGFNILHIFKLIFKYLYQDVYVTIYPPSSLQDQYTYNYLWFRHIDFYYGTTLLQQLYNTYFIMHTIFTALLSIISISVINITDVSGYYGE
jgi:hypothetical protein